MFNTAYTLDHTLTAARVFARSAPRRKLETRLAICRTEALATTCEDTKARIAIWRGVVAAEVDALPEPITVVACAEDMIKKSLEG